MPRQFLLKAISTLLAGVAVMLFVSNGNLFPAGRVAAQARETEGSLQVVDASGKQKNLCPLKHTDVKAEISGFLSRVVVTQEFENPFTEKIEAVYTFPLPQDAAVDDMTMTVGDRTVRGKILRREEAQAVYEAAKTSGQRASLLDQERPNIFTQSVANILPGEQIKITISYVETLKYLDGAYEFVFPMVVGPRYVPGGVTGAQGSGPSNTEQVPDASRIAPPLAPAGMRSGHDISLELTIDAGVPLDALESKTQEVDIERVDAHRAHLHLRNGNEIPNKDFVLRYDVAGKKVADALLTHATGKGGYFTFILQPPERVAATEVMPKELVFVLDTSGSMSGFPIEKAKESMKLALDNLYPTDTFNLITFAGDEHILFPAPVRATKENLRKVEEFLESRQGSGGTEMMKAIKASLDPSDKQDHVRIVCFMTDGYVGNEMEIIGEVQKHPNARVFAFGIGSAVNRFLLDNMAKYGRGEVEYVGLNDDGSAAAQRFHERVRNPLLTDISIDWNGLAVADVYPAQIPDLFGAKPLVLTGRYTTGGKGTIRLQGKMAGRDFVREIPVELPDSQSQHDVLATLWARTRVADLLSQDFKGAQRGHMKPELKEAITQLGLEYRLMTQFTSFVAVEEMVVTEGGQPRRIDVPVEMPEGMSREGILADGDSNGFGIQFFAGHRNGAVPGSISNLSSVTLSGVDTAASTSSSAPANPKLARRDGSSRRSSGAGSGSGVGSGSGGGIAPGRSRNVAGGSITIAGSTSGGSGVVPSPAPAPGSGMYKAEVDVDTLKVRSPEEQKQATLNAKLHASIRAVIDRLKDSKAAPALNEAEFIHDGKAEIQIWLTDKSEETLAELKKLGFEVVLDPKTAKLVIGRLPIEKLAALAEVKGVRYVAPQLIRK
jgi:Ca-activated chloride channel family protein